MDWRRSLFIFSLILLAAGSLTLPAHAADYTITLNGNTFNVTWRINAWQNLTSYGKTLAYPQNLNSNLGGSDLSAFQSALQNALQTKVSTATVNSLIVRVSSNGANLTCTTQCPLQWLNATVQFGVSENVPQNTGVVQYDVSWKSAKISDDLRSGGISFNTIGQPYLVQAITPFVDFSPSPGRSMRVFVQNQSVSRTSYLPVTSSIVLFDMSTFKTPLDGWTQTFDIGNQTQTWTSPKTGGFSAVATLTLAEPGFSTSFVYIAEARISATLSAPLDAQIKGDTIFIDLSRGFWDGIASVAIIASLSVLIGSVVVDRGITGRVRTRRKPRKR